MALEFSVEPTPTPTSPAAAAEIIAAPGFGKVFTDHMVTVAVDAEQRLARRRGYARTAR